MDFSDALVYMKKGFRVRRSGWNGKKMAISFVPAQDHFADPKTAQLLDIKVGDTFHARGYFAMKDAQNCLVVGWLASQTDLAAEDWEPVED